MEEARDLDSRYFGGSNPLIGNCHRVGKEDMVASKATALNSVRVQISSMVHQNGSVAKLAETRET